MAQGAAEIHLGVSDPSINELCRRSGGGEVGYSRHFTQGEDFFLRLGDSFEVPSFSIHHDVTKAEPEQPYLDALQQVVEAVQALIPSVFEDLTFAFDPADILRPSFYQLFRLDDVPYLYLLRIDLVCQPQHHQVLAPGTNDTTPVYRTRDLVLEPLMLPLSSVSGTTTVTSVTVDQMISDTWIGETGRGYFVQGVWLDTDLTKFFSKLFLPAGKRVYPYYPFSSKYRTVCHHPISLDLDSRRKAVPLLHRARGFLLPHLERIEHTLREDSFSEDLPIFAELKAALPSEWSQTWHTLKMSVYLNETDQKEFEVTV
jgi:hypothetical protein